MNEKQKASAVIDYMSERDSDTVINILQAYISDESLANLYDTLVREGVIDAEEDPEPNEDDGMAEGLTYLREQLEQDEIDEIRAQIDRSYRYHMNPSDCCAFCSRVEELLEEYGEDNNLPEDWWMYEGDIDDWLLKL